MAAQALVEHQGDSNAGNIGLGVAIDCARSWEMEAICSRVSELASRLRSALRALVRKGEGGVQLRVTW